MVHSSANCFLFSFFLGAFSLEGWRERGVERCIQFLILVIRLLTFLSFCSLVARKTFINKNENQKLEIKKRREGMPTTKKTIRIQCGSLCAVTSLPLWLSTLQQNDDPYIAQFPHLTREHKTWGRRSLDWER